MKFSRRCRQTWERIRRRRFRDTISGSIPVVAAGHNLEDVAERLTGLQRSELSIGSRVLKDNRRAIVNLHSVSSRGIQAKAGTGHIRIVEKRAIKPYELDFYRIVQSRNRGAGQTLGPELYGTADVARSAGDPRRYTIFLQHLPRSGLPDRSRATAHRLAERICAISSLSLEGYTRSPRPHELTSDILSRFIAVAETKNGLADGAKRQAVEAIRKDWPRMSEIAAMRLRRVPCHHDLHLENIRHLPDGGGDRFVFIDWEEFGCNYLGADLHNLICLGLSDPSYAAFCEAIKERYIDRARETHGVDRQSIDLGAHAYALRRCMLRAVQNSSTTTFPLVSALHKKVVQLLTALVFALGGHKTVEGLGTALVAMV